MEVYDRPDLLRSKVNGTWRLISSQEFGRIVRDLSCGLMSLGVKPGDKVILLSENRPEWAMSDFAILTAGAADVPVYPTLNAKDASYIVNDSDAEVAIVSTPAQAAKLLSVHDAMPKLRDIIVMDPLDAPAPGLLAWDEVLARGGEFSRNQPDLHRQISMAVVPEDLASIVYTSGTTGMPKGAMLTHGNFVENVHGAQGVLTFGPTDLAIVFLPLSHVFERTADYSYFMSGAALAYAESIEVELKIAEDGELLAKGPNIMKGYYKLPEATAEVFTPDGWFMTGDIARVDEDGFYFITDRKKEILVTAGGKNVAPQPIENLLKTNKYVTQAVLIGDCRPYITALIVPNWDSLQDYAKLRGLSLTEPSQFCHHPQIMHLYGNVLARANAHLSHHEQIKKCRLLTRELSQEEGELTPTLKVKRRVIATRYGDLIDSMYSKDGTTAASTTR